MLAPRDGEAVEPDVLYAWPSGNQPCSFKNGRGIQSAYVAN